MRTVTVSKSGRLLGESIGTAKLTWEGVKEIRRRRQAGETLADLSSDYGVSISNVSSIVTGKTWAKEPEALTLCASDEDLPTIRAMCAAGNGYPGIAKALKVSPGSVQRLMSAHGLAGVGPEDLNAAKTHCKHGHPLSGENLHVLPNGERRCKRCNRERTKMHGRKKRAEKRAGNGKV